MSILSSASAFVFILDSVLFDFGFFCFADYDYDYDIYHCVRNKSIWKKLKLQIKKKRNGNLIPF